MVVFIFWGRRVVDLEAFSSEKKRFTKALIIAVKCISRGKKEKEGKQTKKIKRGEQKQKRKERGKKTKKRKERGNAFYRNLVGAVFLNRIFSGEKACTLPTLLLQKIKTNMPIVYRPSSFKILRV